LAGSDFIGFPNVRMQVFQHEQRHLQYHRPYRKLLQVNDPIHLFKIRQSAFNKTKSRKFLPFNTILNPLIVSLSGTNLPGVPVNTSATYKNEK
jgi:hypothetical protein